MKIDKLQLALLLNVVSVAGAFFFFFWSMVWEVGVWQKSLFAMAPLGYVSFALFVFCCVGISGSMMIAIKVSNVIIVEGPQQTIRKKETKICTEERTFEIVQAELFATKSTDRQKRLALLKELEELN